MRWMLAVNLNSLLLWLSTKSIRHASTFSNKFSSSSRSTAFNKVFMFYDSRKKGVSPVSMCTYTLWWKENGQKVVWLLPLIGILGEDKLFCYIFRLSAFQKTETGNHWKGMQRLTKSISVTHRHSCGCCLPACNPRCTHSSMSPGCSHTCPCSSGTEYTRLCLQERGGHENMKKVHDKKRAMKKIYQLFRRWAVHVLCLWLTETLGSIPLVAWRTLAHEGPSGVVARLFRPTSVSACCAFVYVCNEHTDSERELRKVNSIFMQEHMANKAARHVWTTCARWCVNCFPQGAKSVITDTITSHTHMFMHRADD